MVGGSTSMALCTAAVDYEYDSGSKLRATQRGALLPPLGSAILILRTAAAVLTQS